ncbi:14480_t:CDS:2 [Cetraspora pellucida]|uniref:14480_t:CDS:1 n=1 Tax=Cetraspora pellucida TaxID=1433469 RepID=A0A9N9A3W8_9GLOM|nr:14480_t:CDS:2 [Cetraspora pellucida]
MLAIATKIIKKYKLTSKMNISKLGQYTSEFLENFTNDRKQNQACRHLQDSFKFSSKQRSGKTKTINLTTSNRYQNLISILQELKKETIEEMAYRFLQNKLSIRNIRAKAYALALLALNANAGSSQLSRLRKELRNLGASSQISKATKFSDITKDVNEIQKNQ